MENFKKLSKALLIASAITGLMATTFVAPSVAVAQDYPLASQQRADVALAAKNSRPKIRSMPSPNDRSIRTLTKAAEMMDAEPPEYSEAMAVLKKQDLNRLNTTDLASFLQMLANVAQSLDNMPEALGYYKQMLQMESMSYSRRDQITFLVGQIEFSNGNLDIARQYFENWFQYQSTPSMTQLTMMANLYYASGLVDGLAPAAIEIHYRKSIEFFNWAISKSIAEGKEDKENWYAILRSIHNNLEESDKVLEYAELLATRWPKKSYWTDLAGLYAQASTEDGLSEAESIKFEKKQLATYELAHRQGMFDKGSELEVMSQLYLFHESPYQASKVMSKSLESGLSEGSQRNLNLLASAYISGKDTEKSVEPLRKAAELSKDGNLYIQLANIYLQLDKYQEAADAIQAGLNKGDVRRADQSSLLQGQAYLALEKFDDARKSFREAAKDDRSKSNANNLLRYVDNEERRIKDIREYLS